MNKAPANLAIIFNKGEGSHQDRESPVRFGANGGSLRKTVFFSQGYWKTQDTAEKNMGENATQRNFMEPLFQKKSQGSAGQLSTHQ